MSNIFYILYDEIFKISYYINDLSYIILTFVWQFFLCLCNDRFSTSNIIDSRLMQVIIVEINKKLVAKALINSLFPIISWKVFRSWWRIHNNRLEGKTAILNYVMHVRWIPISLYRNLALKTELWINALIKLLTFWVDRLILMNMLIQVYRRVYNQFLFHI